MCSSLFRKPGTPRVKSQLGLLFGEGLYVVTWSTEEYTEDYVLALRSHAVCLAKFGPARLFLRFFSSPLEQEFCQTELYLSLTHIWFGLNFKCETLSETMSGAVGMEWMHGALDKDMNSGGIQGNKVMDQMFVSSGDSYAETWGGK